jgi:hypothetical protein
VGLLKCFRGVYSLLHHFDDGGPSETSVCFNETTRHYVPDGSHLYSRRRENLNGQAYVGVVVGNVFIDTCSCAAAALVCAIYTLLGTDDSTVWP